MGGWRKLFLLAFVASLGPSLVAAQACVVPVDNLLINRSITLCGGIYTLPDDGYYWNYSNYGVLRINNYSIVLDCNGTTLLGGQDSGAAVYNPGFRNVTVKNCFSQNFKYGIHVQNSSTVTLSGNTLFNDMRGSFGVYLNDSHDCLVSGNVLKRHPFGTGLGMEGSYGNNVTLNYVDLNLVGFYVAGSRNNDFFFNNVSRSYLAAVHLFTGSESNRFVENQFIAGFKQIEGNTGLLIQGAKGTELRGNSLCANVNDIICTSAGIASAEGNFCNISSPACGFSCTPCTGRYVIPGWDVLP